MSVRLPLLALDGTLLVGAKITGRVILPLLDLMGPEPPPPPPGFTLPMVSVTGDLKTGRVINMSILLPQMVVAGQFDVGTTVMYGAAVYLPFPVFTLDGAGLSTNFGVANLEIPLFTFEAEGYPSTLGIANVSFPSIHLSATGDVSVIGTLEKQFRAFTLSAAGYLDAVGTASLEFPLMSLSARAIAGIIGNLEKNLPVFTLSGVGTFSNVGTFAKSFPVFSITGIGLAASYLAMVLNLNNQALTLYQNYEFNSLCRFNDKHFGATDTNIYDLDTGATDAGDLIDWNMRTGYVDLEQKKKKRMREAWLSYTSDGDVLVTVIQPDGEEHEYMLSGVYETDTGLKLKFGKGIRSKYVALDIESVNGSTITLDVLKLQLEKAGARR